MDNRFKDAVDRAYRYAQNHPRINRVSEISICENGVLTFTATFRVNLPGRFDKEGITSKGVKKTEPVTFEFFETFPYTAPNIKLRDDFSRDFPHIFPTTESVRPCIFEGKIEDLLQQPKWMDGIYDQISHWLEKAASNSLMDLKQGWEPIMTDSNENSIVYNKKDVISFNDDESKMLWVKCICEKPLFLILKLKPETQKVFPAVIFRLPDNKISEKYFSYFIKDFGDLCEFATENSFVNFKERVNSINKSSNGLVVIFIIRRPANLIGSDTPIEFINFFIIIERNKKKPKKSINIKSKVLYLSLKDVCNPELLKRFSGMCNTNASTRTVLQLGCGSLGSKISMHLAKNGNDNFILVDNSIFSPHNNARHALTFFGRAPKTDILSVAMLNMGVSPEYKTDEVQRVLSVLRKDIKNLVIIDSTASLAVRNFLSTTPQPYPIIHTSLYNHSKFALFVAESNDRNPRLDDLLVKVYSQCLKNEIIRTSLFTEQSVRMSTGQGCSSYTTIAPDSRISLAAAGMAAKIQHYISNGMPECGEIFIGTIVYNDMGIEWKRISCEKIKVIPPTETDWEIRIHQNVVEQIEAESRHYSSLETGGALVGHISDANQCITICDLIPAPEDSKRSRTQFDLGIQGLREKVLEVIKKTNGLLTYVGTWHSHPFGGTASDLDKRTKERIKELRNISPTACLIWTPGGILRT